jgi:PhzF family phenazine biosynthesis protein
VSKESLRLSLYDVFADTPFSGCPAAVVRATRPHPISLLESLAKELNFPETCLYWPQDDIVKVHFATSEGIIDACGHGLLAVLADAVRTSSSGNGRVVRYQIASFNPGEGKIHQKESRFFAVAAKWFKWPELGAILPSDETAKLLRIPQNSIRKDLPLLIVDSQIRNGLVPIIDEPTLLKIKPDYGIIWEKYFKKNELADLHLYVLSESACDQSKILHFRTRNVFPYGVREEAATGTASVSMAAAFLKLFDSGCEVFKFRQGLNRVGGICVKAKKDMNDRRVLWLEGNVIPIALDAELFYH